MNFKLSSIVSVSTFNGSFPHEISKIDNKKTPIIGYLNINSTIFEQIKTFQKYEKKSNGHEDSVKKSMC